MFENLDNIEFEEISLDDTANFAESSHVQENYEILDSSSAVQSWDYGSVSSSEEFIHHYSGSLTPDDVNDSIQSASEFFNMDSPMIVSEGKTTGVINRDLTTVSDDILIYNPDQLQSMGITEKEGLDLVMTHENTHRALQGLDTGFSDHQEELCCDYMSGVRAGLNSIETEQMENSLANMPESITHPAGELRVEAFQEGQEFALRYLEEHGHAPSFNDCFEHFKSSQAYAQTSDPLALVPNTGNENEFHGYTQADVERLEHLAEASSGSEQAHWLKEAQWAKEHLNSVAYSDSIQGFIDDRAYHLRQAQTAKENAEWHHKRADEAVEREDLSNARDHNYRAGIYEKEYNDHINASKKCTK